MAMMNSRLSNKLRLSTLVLLTFVLLSSLVSYMKMRQVSLLWEAVAGTRIPALSAVRGLHGAELGESSALQSYVLFGSDAAMAQRYSSEIQAYRTNSLSILQRIAQLRSTYDSLVGAEKIDTLSTNTAGDEIDKQLQNLAVGRGVSDNTSRAFDLLQGPAAKANADFLKSVTEVVDTLVDATNNDLKHVVEINRLEAIHLWLFIFLGGLLGVCMSELTMHRVVRSIYLVMSRAQSIAEGDLTGKPMHMGSNDEITSLAGSINRMQDNLREMIRTMMEISGIVSENSAKLSRRTNLFAAPRNKACRPSRPQPPCRRCRFLSPKYRAMRKMLRRIQSRPQRRRAMAARSSSRCW